MIGSIWNTVTDPAGFAVEALAGGGDDGGCCCKGGDDETKPSGPLSPEFEAAYDGLLRSIENMPGYIQQGIDSINQHGAFGMPPSLA